MTELEQALAHVDSCGGEGRLAVVRTRPSVARAVQERLGRREVVRFLELSVGEAAVWLADGPGHVEAAEALVAGGLLVRRPGVLLLTGGARDAAPPAVGLTLAGDEAPAEGAAHVALDFDPEGPVADLEEQMRELADHGDLLDASARWACLFRRAPERAARTSWVPLERLLRGGRSDDVLDQAMALPVAAEARSRVLLAVATARYHRGQLGPWMGMLQKLALDDDEQLRSDATIFLAYVRGDLEQVVQGMGPSTTWQRALGEASLLETGKLGLEDLTWFPGKFAAALRMFFVERRQEEAVAMAVSAGHHRDAVMMAAGWGEPPPESEAYRDLVSSSIARRCVRALEEGRPADARRALDEAPPEVLSSRDVWSNSLAMYEAVTAATEGDRASVLAALATAERRGAPLPRSNGLRRMWLRLQRCGGTPDPWIAARVAGWVLERLDGIEAVELSAQTLPSLPERPLALGPYALEERVGSGGMGEVWRARHAATDQLVAVKVLRKDRVDRDAEAFAAEVELTSRLEHPGIVGVLDLGVVGDAVSLQSRGQLAPGQPYLVMEYVEGGTLEAHVGRVDYDGLCAVASALLDALAYAHARGVLHRDLKPENVLVTSSGAVRLSDFGLSAYRTDRAAGTPYYMAPEQFRGAPLSPRTDLYGLGCLLWHVVSGVPLFTGTLRALRDGHLGSERPALRAQVAVPEGLEAWLHKLVSPAPSFRFASAQEASHALREVSGEVRPAHPGVRLPGMPTSSTTFIMDGVLDGARPADPLPVQSAPLPDVWAGPGGWSGRPRLPTERMLDRGDPRLVAHAGGVQELWQALREVQRTGRRRDVVVDAPWGSLAMLVDEVRLAARTHGARVADEPESGALAVVVGQVDASSSGPWLVVNQGRGAGATHVPRADLIEMLETAGRRLPLDLATAGSAALRAWGHPALVGVALQAWSIDPGYRVGRKGLGLIGPPHEHTALEAWWAEHVATLEPAERQLLALASFFDDGAPRDAVQAMERTAGRSLDEMGAVARWRHDRLFLPPDLRRWLRRKHAPDAEGFHRVLAELFSDDAEGRAHASGHRLRSGQAGAPRAWVEEVLIPSYEHGVPSWPSEGLGLEAWLAFDQNLDAAPEHRAWVRLLLHHQALRRRPEASDVALAELGRAHPPVAAHADAVRWWARAAGLRQGAVEPASSPVLPVAMALRAGWCWRRGERSEAEQWAERALGESTSPGERARVQGIVGRLMPGASSQSEWLRGATEALAAGRERARSHAALGWAMLAKGAFSQAAASAQAALRDDPFHVGARLLSAWSAWQRGADPVPDVLVALECALSDGRSELAGQAITGVLWAQPDMRPSRREVLFRWARPLPGMLGSVAPGRAEQTLAQVPSLRALIEPA